MIREVIQIQEHYCETAHRIVPFFHAKYGKGKRLVIAIGGESGSGKSVTAVCLHQVLTQLGHACRLIHLDDYFFLPPNSNHQQRLKGLEFVGMQEVNMALLQAHIDAFLAGQTTLVKPVSNYLTNTLEEETLDLEGVGVLIVEGVYALALHSVNLKIFILKNYLETKAQRLQRARDPDDAYIEQILAIEHQIIQPMGLTADVLIDKEYQAYGNPLLHEK
jgi:uridine kinase